MPDREARILGGPRRDQRFAALDGQLGSALRDAGGQTTAVVVGTEPMLTTTEAADFLGVSRPYLTRLLKAGKVPYRKTGNRHLVPAVALREFTAHRDRQLDQLDRLAEAEEDLGSR